jgi:hypothetical protein
MRRAAMRRDAPGQSTFAAPLEAETSNTFWLTLSTHGLAPGEYRGQIRFSNAAMKPLDFQVKVWPVRLRETGVLLEDAIKQGLIKENALPQLDFSYFDPFVETPLLAGMPYFHFNFKNLPTDWIGYARDITGDPKLVPDSPRHIAVKRWLLRQIVQYLHGKGITKIVCFIADEIGPDEIPDVLRRAQLLHEFGIRVEFTATGQTGQKREFISALNPAIDRWIWNTVILPQAQAILKTDAPIDKTDTQWNYVADWHRAPYVFNRTRGAFCAYHDLDGLMIHGYLRWYPNGGAVFDAPAGPIDTEGWEGARDGIEDARYWKRAQFLLRAAKKNPALAAEVARIEKQMARWVAPDGAALVDLQNAAYGIYQFQNPVSSYEKLQRLKRELLESLAWLEEKVSTAQTLEYSGLALIEAGQPRAQLLGAALNGVLARRGLPSLSQAAAQTKIVLGTRAELDAILGKDFLGEVTPRADGYQIVVKDKTIAVVGGDAAGVLKGAKILGQLIESLAVAL